jgi:predicted DNA-binding protein (UPF0251 family)
MNELEIPTEFIEENKANLVQFMPKSRRPGPYSKKDKEARRNEVYRLCFEYGYSARKISDLMKVNRNTINSDINYLYSKLAKESAVFNPESAIIITTERLDVQRTRLREMLDNAPTIQEKLAIEKMIGDIDYKLTNIFQRTSESTRRIYDTSIDYLNEYLKSRNSNDRYLTFGDRLRLSSSAKDKVDKIIQEDRKKLG